MIKREYGENTPAETRAEANDTVDRKKRYKQIKECLKEAKEKGGLAGLTAKECAILMCKKGYIPTDERNFTAPRLTEMCDSGQVEPIGKVTCKSTGKTVTVYALREYVK